jgi:hypothetical protein
MRRLATVRPSDGLHVIGPAPAGLEDEPTDLTLANFDDLGSTIGKRAGSVWPLKGDVTRFQAATTHLLAGLIAGPIANNRLTDGAAPRH